MSYRQARLLLLACGLTWSSSIAIKPGSFDLTFERPKKARLIVNLVNCIGRTSPKQHNVRLYLVKLDTVIRMQTHKIASRIAEIPKMLDHVRGTLENRPLPEGYKSIEHVIQEALIASFVYGMRVAPEKILTLSCIPIFPLTNRRIP